MGALPAGGFELLLCTGEVGLVSALWNGTDTLTHIGDAVRIFDYDLVGDLIAEVVELTEHFLGGAQVNGHGLVGVAEFHAGKENTAVDFILLVKEVGVAGGAYRLSKLFAKGVDLTVDVHKILIALDVALLIIDKETVVGDRLNFKIIVEQSDVLDLLIALVIKDSLIKLA